MSDLEGVMLSDYLLLQYISKGGVADVYRARHNTEDSYEVAVKVFRPGYAQRESFREYFMLEAEKIGQFDHANILPFLEYGEGEDLLYLVTPLVTTGTLEDLLQRVGGRFSATQALPIVQQLCSAVQYAHDHDVIHGNIKPTNVFVAGDGRMLLADFGIARRYDDSQQSLTRVGWGSAEYAAPEQSLGVLRRASDIYSLGVLFFRILTGTAPFSGQTPVEVLLKHVRQAPPSARSYVANISDAVDGVLRMAMQKRSDDRFASAEELSHAFLAAVTVAPFASPVSRPASTGELKSATSQLLSPMHPQTPAPISWSQNTLPGDPKTPIPPYIALSSSVPAVGIQEFSPLVSREVPSQVPPANRGSDMSDVTQVRKKNFLQEQDDKTSSPFWSVDPSEWSPITKDLDAGVPHAVPLSAGEYLQRKPVAPEALPTPLEIKHDVEPEQQVEPEQDKQPVTFADHVKKWLPLVVVILLILGLLGALFSAFLFPTDNPSGYAGQTLAAINIMSRGIL